MFQFSVYVLKVTLNKHRNVSDCTMQHCAVTELRFEQELCFSGALGLKHNACFVYSASLPKSQDTTTSSSKDLTVSVV